jgi:aryl-alcohol dehydrogenase-like predicted oxidoreductase
LRPDLVPFLYAAVGCMKTKRLGNSDLDITSIGLGTYAIGGSGWRFAWGPQDDAQSIATIRHALASGINWIDTAPVYGLGHAEEIVGRAIAGLPKRPYIFTKCALVWDAGGRISRVMKSDSIRREVENSLRRLRIDVIDLMQVHWPGAEEDLDEAWETLALLKEHGKVRHIGVSNFDVGQMERVRKIAPITSLQPPYSALDRGIEAEVLPYAAMHRIGVVAYAPMQSGLLSGKMTRDRIAALPMDDWRRGSKDFQEPLLSRNLAVADVLDAVARELSPAGGRPLTGAEIAVAWVLQQPAVTGAIVGARQPDHVDDFVLADEVRLHASHFARIDSARTAG